MVPAMSYADGAMQTDGSQEPQLEELWRRFEAYDPVIRGIAAACALVVAADSRVALIEVLRFASLFEDACRRHACASREADAFGRMATDFQDLATAFVRHPDEARNQALSILEKFANDATRRDTIIAAARGAIVAEHGADEQEQAALRDISAALRLPGAS
jgi:hypothetical protein